MNQKCVVQLQYGDYSGKVTIFCDEDTECETIIAQAFQKVDATFLSMASKSGKIISRESV